MRAEVKSHQQANDALQQATGEKSALKEEVQELSQRLGSALDQIQKLTVDLATTKSLLDMQDRDRQAANAGASTSAPAATTMRIPAQAKGKKTPSRSDTPMMSAGSRHAAPSKDDDSMRHGLDDGGDRDDETSSVDSDGNRWVPIGRMLGKKKLGPGDCKDSRGCGTPPPAPAHQPARVRFEIKPKDPPAYHGKATEDVEVWSQQVDNYLQLLGGDDDMQVAYVGTLLQGAAQLWFQRENNAGRRPRTWTQLAESLCDRFGNPTKADYAQSQLSSMRQGKNESAHDYSLRFEAVLDKIPAYEESWVKNIFIWGLHSNIAQEVNMKNPRSLNRAMELAKRADVAITMARRPAQRDAGSQEQKKPAAGQQPEQQRRTRVLAKQENKTKIGSLATLELLGVSPNAQVVIRRGTGQVIPSFVGGAAIQRLPRTLGLVRGHLVRGTSAGCGLQLCSRRIRTQR